MHLRVSTTLFLMLAASCRDSSLGHDDELTSFAIGAASFNTTTNCPTTCCSATDITYLTDVAAKAKSIVSSLAFENCVSNYVINFYSSCAEDPDCVTGSDPETTRCVLKAVRNVNSIAVDCGGSPQADATSYDLEYGKSLVEWYQWYRNSLTQSEQMNTKTTAAMIHHLELLHQEGFRHYPNCTQTMSHGIGWNMHDVVSNCIAQVMDDSISVCQLASCSGGFLVVSDWHASSCTCVEPVCEDFLDSDADGLGDRCDRCPMDPTQDSDSDGVCSGDNCPSVPNGDQADADLDGLGDACDSCKNDAVQDTDSDGVCSTDNCPTTWNLSQANMDADGLGDACDPDIDGDGVAQYPYGTDNCPYIANASQLDVDHDDMGDECDCWQLTKPNPQTWGPLDCTPARAKAWIMTMLDDRMAAIAQYLEDHDGIFSFDNPDAYVTCKFTPACVNNNPTASPGYAKASAYASTHPLGGWRRTFTVNDVARIMRMENGPTISDIQLFFGRRLKGEYRVNSEL